jgi:hypothetical protein
MDEELSIVLVDVSGSHVSKVRREGEKNRVW